MQLVVSATRQVPAPVLRPDFTLYCCNPWILPYGPPTSADGETGELVMCNPRRGLKQWTLAGIRVLGAYPVDRRLAATYIATISMLAPMNQFYADQSCGARHDASTILSQ